MLKSKAGASYELSQTNTDKIDADLPSSPLHGARPVGKQLSFNDIEETVEDERPKKGWMESGWCVPATIVGVLTLAGVVIIAATVGASENNSGVLNDDNSAYYTYNADESVSGAQFSSAFNFETMDDPKLGFADFQSLDSATSLGMYSVNSQGQVRIGADHTQVVDPKAERGRKSMRVSSKVAYGPNTLFMVDIEHMPSSSGSLADGCGVWPSFWTLGPDWPLSGEMIVIEYTNDDTLNQNTLHTGPFCDQGIAGTHEGLDFTGYWAYGRYGNDADNCDAFYCIDQWCLQGCSVINSDQYVGAEFNRRNEGGIFAIEWVEEKYIRMFHFRRDDLPADIVRGTPNPDSWGKPSSYFSLDPFACADNHFHDHKITFDISFCGSWAGNATQQHVECTCPAADPNCFETADSFETMCQPSDGSTCEDYVANNPSYFEEAYWLINSISVFDITTEPASAHFLC
jgi:hypothetical protein